MAQYNPRDPRQIARLRQAMKWSATQLRPFRDEYLSLVRQYAGAHYGNNAASDKVPVNLLKMAVSIYGRQLVSRTPRVLVTTSDPAAKAEAYELEVATNMLLEQQLNLGRVLRDAVKDALFLMGIIKVGVGPSSGMDLQTEFDPGQPYAEQVLFEDWLHDMTAKRLEDMDWCGNRYKLPLDVVQNTEIFNEKVRNKLTPSDGGDMASETNSQQDRVSTLSQGNSPLKEEYRDHVELWDIWLPKDRLLITMAADLEDEPLRIVEWEGPRNGPFHLLRFDTIPGNILPVSPGMNLWDLHDLLNGLFRQLGRQALRQKTVTVVSGQAAADGTAQAILDCEDGQTIRTDDPNSVKEMKYGGIDQASFAFTLGLRDLFSWQAGNLDSIGGLSPQAQTLGQEEILKASSGTLVGEMQGETLLFAKGIMTDLAKYIYQDKMSSTRLQKIEPGLGISLPFQWTPARRQRPWSDFNMDIEPYSMQSRGPGERLSTLTSMVTQMIIPMMPQLAQQGITFNAEAFLRLVARYADMDELTELISSSGSPITKGPIGSDSGGGQGQGGPDYVSTASPTTNRTYTRRNVPTQGSTSGQSTQMIQALLGAGGGGAGPARR